MTDAETITALRQSLDDGEKGLCILAGEIANLRDAERALRQENADLKRELEKARDSDLHHNDEDVHAAYARAKEAEAALEAVWGELAEADGHDSLAKAEGGGRHGHRPSGASTAPVQEGSSGGRF